MSIGPVSGSVSPAAPQVEDRTPKRPAKAAQSAPIPNSEYSPSREAARLENTSPVPPIPEDEVKVQWDNPMADRILVYQFLNQQSGSLILQLPSEQVLSVAHGIQQMFQEDAAKVAADQAESGKVK